MSTEDASRGCPGYENALKTNWNGNITFDTTVQFPSSIEDLQNMVREANQVRVVGRGHSFTPLAKSSDTILCLKKLNRILDYQPPSRQSNGCITIEGGTTYTEVIQFLNRQTVRGALPNLPSCPQFTVAGSIATGTHGSGIAIQNLSAHVSMLEFVTSDGTLIQCHDTGCRVHLGCFGVVSRLTLDVVPYYTVEAVRYDDLSLETMLHNLPNWYSRCDSLSVWTSGFGQGVGKGTCWATFRRFITEDEQNDKNGNVSTAFLEKEELGERGFMCEHSVPRYCTDPAAPEFFCPTGTGPWYDYLTVTMADGEETCMITKDLQAEFFVPLQHAKAALRAVWDAVEEREWAFSPPWGYKHDGNGDAPKRGMVDAMEFRQVKAGDGAWLSPHHEDMNEPDTDAFLGVHISFNGDPALRTTIQNECLPVIEKALQPFGARPHWGKLATSDLYCFSRIQKLYGKEAIEKFQALCQKHDQKGKFRTDFLKQCLFGSK